MHEHVRKKVEQVQWIDSESRFVARVSPQQDTPWLVRLDIRIPTVVHNTTDGDMGEISEDNIFIAMHDVLLLRPYNPRNAMLATNPSLYEVAVTVDNFWSAHESGGNSGRQVRRGVVYVSGETEPLRRLCDDKDTRSKPRRDGVRGISHVLQGAINLRRMRTGETSLATDVASRWMCVDYSLTHHFHCTEIPSCRLRVNHQAAVVNQACFNLDNLFLERQFGNIQDTNAIAIVQQSNGNKIVGFVPRELAECLAPALDAGIATVGSKGVYSENELPGHKRHRVWFCVTIGGGGAGAVDSLLIDSLRAIPWWVVNEDNVFA